MVRPIGASIRPGIRNSPRWPKNISGPKLEYWRELELLSGQREHFKPGRTDETAYADDEVAA